MSSDEPIGYEKKYFFLLNLCRSLSSGEINLLNFNHQIRNHIDMDISVWHQSILDEQKE
tara:strand:- start:55 stop:231 length:177 start_codon:yes stop_codon:yes gene_type:complete